MLARIVGVFFSIDDKVHLRNEANALVTLLQWDKFVPRDAALRLSSIIGFKQQLIEGRKFQVSGMQAAECGNCSPATESKGSLEAGKLLKEVSRAFRRNGSKEECTASSSSAHAWITNGQLTHKLRAISLTQKREESYESGLRSGVHLHRGLSKIALGLTLITSLVVCSFLVASTMVPPQCPPETAATVRIAPSSNCWKFSGVVPAFGSLAVCLCLLGIWFKDAPLRGKLHPPGTCSECSHNEAEDADRLAQRAQHAKQQFMAYVFHNIRVPFNAIVLGLGHMRASASGEEVHSKSGDTLDLVQLMLDCAETMTNVLDDVTDMGNWEDGRIELNRNEFDLLAVVKFLAWGLQDLLQQKQISLNMDIDPVASKILESHNIVGDKHRIVQTLGNFLSNAVKFTPTGGNLYMEIKCEELDCRVISPLSTVQTSAPEYKGTAVATEHNSIKLFIAVNDTGTGLSTDQEELFEPDSFITSAWIQKAGVSGLGLSVAKRFIEQIGGQIGVRPRKQGNTFYFSAPFALVQKRPIASGVFYNGCTDFDQKTKQWPSSANLERPCEVDSVNGSADCTRQQSSPCKRRVLLVEDTKINRIILRKVLQNLNLQCDEAENGQIAVDLHRQGNSYDLVLMDKEMPVMDGHEATRALRMMGVETPIVALTGNALQSDKELFFEAGVNEFQTKPLSRDKLIQLLARYGVESSSHPREGFVRL